MQQSVSMEKRQITVSAVRQKLEHFEQTINHTLQSAFMKEIQRMFEVFSCTLYVRHQIILLDVLTFEVDADQTLIATIIHAISSFFHAIDILPAAQLHITIALTTQSRVWPLHIPMKCENMTQLKEYSAAFTVSGVSYHDEVHHIVVTKREEIIKLLFHELIHYARLDEGFRMVKPHTWNIKTPQLHYNEGYAEFLSNLFYIFYTCVRLHTTNIMEAVMHYMYTEMEYAYELAAKTLTLYGYQASTIADFFRQNQRLHECSIYIWEYVILRAFLWSEYNTWITWLHHWRVPASTAKRILNLPSQSLIQHIKSYMQHESLKSNVWSYIKLNVDWNAHTMYLNIA